MPKLDPQHSFVVGNGLKPSSLVVRADSDIPDDALLSGRFTPKDPLVFLPHLGRRPDDLILTSHVTIRLISERFRHTLVGNGFTGWKSFPVMVYGRFGKVHKGYSGLSVIGRCGPIDRKKSIPTEIVRSGVRLQMLSGLFFDPVSWDGSDLFLSPGWAHIFCTERVAEAIAVADLSNVRLTRASEHLHPGLAPSEYYR
jgi:hypothetical protein